MRPFLLATAALLLALPAVAQQTAPLYDAARDAGASDADAAGLAKAISAVQEAQLLATGGAAGDFFGSSVSLSGDRALVGAVFNDVGGVSNAGSAYVFERQAGGAWTQVAQLVATGGGANDRFGNSVSLSGDRALVGAAFDSAGGVSAAGSAYVFERQAGGAWAQTAQLLASGRASADFFGRSVSLSGERVLVGADGDDVAGVINVGSATVFERQAGGTWAQTAQLLASGRASADFFGRSVSLLGERALVGSPGDDVAGVSNAGSATVFEWQAGGAWTQTAQLAATGGAVNDSFGFSVSLSGERALVGAFGDDVGAATDAGSAYVFERRAGGAWTQTAQLLLTDGASADFFGFSVSLSGERALIGADGDDVAGVSDAGSAYVFALGPLGTAVAEDGGNERFALSVARPNPASGRAGMTLALDRPQHVRATLVDALGRTVAVLHDGEAAGVLALSVDAGRLAPGVYVVRVAGATATATRRITVAR